MPGMSHIALHAYAKSAQMRIFQAPRLHAFSAPNALVQLRRRGRRRDIQLVAQRLDADLILAQRQVMLALSAVAAHQAAVRVLAAVILRQHMLAQARARSILPLAKIDLA